MHSKPLPPPRYSTAGIVLFSAAIFASASLIFLVQPMVGKHILPWFGGAPGVWLLCLAFYQTTLFLGYAYAHGLAEWVPPRAQLVVHGLLFALALAMLPVLPDSVWKPSGAEDPSGRILSMLVASVAAPFFMLASTGPLVQSWFARSFPGRSPYPLYAVSNVGSLLALLTFPFLLEPRIPLSSLSGWWTLGFAASGVLVLSCAAWAAFRGGVAHEEGPASDGRPAVIRAGDVALWIGLAAAAVVMFMGVTNKVSLDIASVPFLWIVPLSIYLITFILCFASEKLYRRDVFVVLGICSLALVLIFEWRWMPTALKYFTQSAQLRIGFYSLGLFAGCMLAHGELYRLRPAPQRLTAFYLCVSGGGALGGLFVGLLAPRVLADYVELPIGVGMCWVAVLVSIWRDPRSFLHTRRTGAGLALAAVITLGTAGVYVYQEGRPAKGVVAQVRNFFGVLRVIDVTPPQGLSFTRLRNGTTMHGTQLNGKHADRPTTYYGSLTGLGLALGRKEGAPRRIGVIGLGVGTIATYGRPADEVIFYEIDPDVTRFARTYFSFLADSKATVEVVEGDARLSLESALREGDPEGYDLLVVDAFSSDAIPVHLLTREAMEVYRAHLAPGGAIAIHASNRHFALASLVFRLADSLGMQCLAVVNQGFPRAQTSKAIWLFVAEDRGYLDDLAKHVEDIRAKKTIAKRGLRTLTQTPEQAKAGPLWTDDYSDLFSLMVPLDVLGGS